MGDMNGRVGNNNKGIERYMGPYEETAINDNGSRPTDLCVENDFVILNTKFMHKDIHMYTREVCSRNERSVIDYFMINTENCKRVKVKVKRHAEIGSDHYLVRMELWTNSNNKQEEKRMKIVKHKIKSYKLKEKDNQKVYQDILEKKFEQHVGKNKEIKTKWKKFKDNILEAVRVSFGTTRNQIRSREKLGGGQ